ncbi:uncharacterized protein SPPG_04336 [Spizellomyces punctatus DAOM BR117]|uniref:60S ribosomal subunit assembly/export protein LOC1 n=1 Tax=Spizellomyces punctatus (strain DAOM BR117) TaxID=645134 RepID=A0A0L0HK33_SPIPD|nr:uncharacterized protein SPPG_04336 [Spizellomyces punctatus DAOM BR117]KND01245.1 hypothetical protein SPPG_04336 [Spizellomyces punctatus DAOM BR117]|eukprot:XP_016609284.1 hypothetical protein SPPG_04336 [Spizellomyces punctatus DAOM BR117]
MKPKNPARRNVPLKPQIPGKTIKKSAGSGGRRTTKPKAVSNEIPKTLTTSAAAPAAAPAPTPTPTSASTAVSDEATLASIPTTSRKKGKKFPTQSHLLSLIDAISTQQDQVITNKLARHHANAARNSVKQKKTQDKKREKRAEIEVIKKQLRMEKGKKKKRKSKEEPEQDSESGGKPKKRVTFDL